VLGAELRKARETAGLTQEQVAAKANITREYVGLLERDEYNPTVDVLMRVCAAIGTKAWLVVKKVEEP
jgi:transcriptional regulator with XRE-family HTH domain